jgi:hypothetical protein
LRDEILGTETAAHGAIVGNGAGLDRGEGRDDVGMLLEPDIPPIMMSLFESLPAPVHHVRGIVVGCLCPGVIAADGVEAG